MRPSQRLSKVPLFPGECSHKGLVLAVSPAGNVPAASCMLSRLPEDEQLQCKAAVCKPAAAAMLEAVLSWHPAGC